MQYTDHYNLNLPEGSDIVNPLVQDNPNYTAIDNALYANKLRVIGGATHVKAGTNHAITLADSDIVAFRFVATGDFVIGDTFTVDGVTVTPRIANGASIPSGAFKINSSVLCVLDGTILNLINVDGAANADDVNYDNMSSGLSAANVQDAIDELNNNIDVSRTWKRYAEDTTNGTITITQPFKEVLIDVSATSGTSAPRLSMLFAAGFATKKRSGYYAASNNYAIVDVTFDGASSFVVGLTNAGVALTSYTNVYYR